nr:KUP/HAK/KT family potassium transporter [Thermosulfidibacter takaii]
MRVRKEAVFFSGRPDVVPLSLIQNLKHNGVIHVKTLLVHIAFVDVPRVPNLEKITVDKLGGGFIEL